MIRQTDTCLLFDFAFSGDKNVMKKKDKIILKHTNLKIKIETCAIEKPKP